MSTESTVRAASGAVNGWSAEYLDAMYAKYKADPDSVPADLRAFMQGFDLGIDRPAGGGAASGGSSADLHAERIAMVFRRFGHREATLDPLGSVRPEAGPIKGVLALISEADRGREDRA